jgi:hypothetical protein
MEQQGIFHEMDQDQSDKPIESQNLRPPPTQKIHPEENQTQSEHYFQTLLIPENILPFSCSQVNFNQETNDRKITHLVIAIYVSSYRSLLSVLQTWANCSRLEETLPLQTNTTFISFTTRTLNSKSIQFIFPNASFFEATRQILKHLYFEYPTGQWYMIIKDNTILYIDNLYKALQNESRFPEPTKENYYCGYPLRQPNTSLIFASGCQERKKREKRKKKGIQVCLLDFFLIRNVHKMHQLGDAGFVLSRGTLQTLMSNNFEDNCHFVADASVSIERRDGTSFTSFLRVLR